MAKKQRKGKVLEVWTDGSCYAKHPKKLGGSSVYIKWKDKEYHIRKGFSHTTIGRRETEAVLMALRTIRKDLRATVTFYIDSQYVADQLRYKFVDWVREDLRVENQDLWEKIFMEVLEHTKLRIKVKWIPGHGKDYNDPIVCGNFIADYLADYKKFSEYEKDNYLQ